MIYGANQIGTRGESMAFAAKRTVRRACVVAVCAAFGVSGGTAVTPSVGLSAAMASATVTPSVRLLYVVPADRSLRSDYADAIENAILSLQSWYGAQVGRTFSLFSNRPEICNLPNAAAYYANDSWSKVLADVQSCAPVSYNSRTFVWVLYVDIVHACNAPGRLGAGTSGITMLPRQDMDGLIGAQYFDDCGIQYTLPVGRYIGGLGHELGHAFGLSHPPGCDQGLPSCDQNALMWLGYVRYPDTYLRADDKQILLATPFFTPPPPPPPPPPGGQGGPSLPPNGPSPISQQQTSTKARCVVPKVRGLRVKKAKKKLARAGCRYRIRGKGRVISTYPQAGTRTANTILVKAKSKPHSAKGKGRKAAAAAHRGVQ